MTERDLFIAATLAGMYANQRLAGTLDSLARDAIKQADATMEALERDRLTVWDCGPVPAAGGYWLRNGDKRWPICCAAGDVPAYEWCGPMNMPGGDS